MPWCPTCERYLTPPSVHVDGSCPTCGRPVETGAVAARSVAPPEPAPETEASLPPIPWHLKLLAGGLAVYLGYRFFEMVEWLVRRL